MTDSQKLDLILNRLDAIDQREIENAKAHAVFQASIDNMNKTLGEHSLILGEHSLILGEHSNILGSIKEMMFKSQNPAA